MHEVRASTGRIVVLGRREENLARVVIFDISEWRQLYGEGNVQLLHQRCQDPTPYPCAITVEGRIVRWVIGAADVDVPGEGKAELQYRVGDTVVKSATYRTLTMPALSPAGPVPEAEKSWVEQVLQAARDAEQSAQEAKNAVTQTITIGDNGNWLIDGEDTGVSAKGPQGERGEQGERGLVGDPGPVGPRGPAGDSGLPVVVSLAGAVQSLALANNTDYRCVDAVTALTVTGFAADPNGRSEAWSIRFVAGAPVTVTLPDTVVWNYGATPVFTPGSEYCLMFAPLLSGKVLGVWNEVEA